MMVSAQTENELKELIRFRVNKEIDDEYIKLLADIMNSDPIFQGQIVIERTDNKTLMSMDYQDFKVRYNLEFLKSQFAKKICRFSTAWSV